MQRFRAVFDLPEGGDGADEQILTLKQGKNTASEFSLAFRKLAAQTGWPDDPLKLHFCRGLSPELQTELACRNEGKTLDQLIDLPIRIDHLIISRKPSRGSTFHSLSPPVVHEKEAIQVGHAGISPEERDLWYRQILCLYCGQAGHVKISCPTRPKQHAFSAVSQSFNSSRCVKVPVKLAFNDGVIETVALIDSESAGNFINADFSKSHDLPLIPCKSPLAVAATLAIFPLSQPETESRRTYIEEELAKGFIVPSKSPASAGFFFVKKREGTLRPCIDYRGLHDITIKFRYPPDSGPYNSRTASFSQIFY